MPLKDMSSHKKKMAAVSFEAMLCFGYLAFLDPYFDPRGFRIGNSLSGAAFGLNLAQFMYQFEGVFRRKD